MNISIISKDLELINKLKDTNCFNNINHFDNLQCDKNSDTDILVVSDKLVDINGMLELKNSECANIEYVFYMISEENYKINTQSILSVENIIAIAPKLTPSQIVEVICNETIGLKQRKKIVTFFGTDSKVGTSQISQSVAELISNNTKANVLLTFLNGRPGISYLENKGNGLGLDSIRTKLFNNVLSVNELLDGCIKNENYYVLPGSYNITNNRFYHPKHIEKLLEVASKKFDVIIIDAGNSQNIELGMTIGSLNATSLRYLVTTQQESSYENYMLIENILKDKLNIKDFMLVINKYINDTNLINSYELADKYKFTLATEVPFLEWGWQSEKEKKILLKYENEEYINNLAKLAKILCKQLELDYKEEEIKKDSWLKKIFK